LTLAVLSDNGMPPTIPIAYRNAIQMAEYPKALI
jgi:hypothetical protein